MGLLAERALEAGFGGEEEASDGLPVPISGTRAERYQVVLHVEAETLETEASPVWSGTDAGATAESLTASGADAAAETAQAESGRSEFDDGTRVSPHDVRRSRVSAETSFPSSWVARLI